MRTLYASLMILRTARFLCVLYTQKFGLTRPLVFIQQLDERSSRTRLISMLLSCIRENDSGEINWIGSIEVLKLERNRWHKCAGGSCVVRKK